MSTPTPASPNTQQLTVHQRVEALFAGTRELHNAAVPIRNVILHLGAHRTALEDALAGTYYRMCLMIESLTRLNHPQDFQVSLHCARCLYELYLDVVTLIRDPSLVVKYNAFTFVARFAAAKKLVDALTAQGITDQTINPHERAFVGDAANIAKLNIELATYWPHLRTPPLNWTGQDLPHRARSIGPQEILRYRRLYSFFCWYSHAGIVGIASLSADGLECAMGMAHGHSQDFFLEATHLVATTFDIYRANPALKPPVDQYATATARVLMMHRRSLESPP